MEHGSVNGNAAAPTQGFVIVDRLSELDWLVEVVEEAVNAERNEVHCAH